MSFVADSQKHKKLANLESYNNMEENLRELGKDLRELPHVLQFNKVDLPAIMTPDELSQVLNKHNVPFFETVATTGIGVLDSSEKHHETRVQRSQQESTLAEEIAHDNWRIGATEYSMGCNSPPRLGPTAIKTAPPPAPPPPLLRRRTGTGSADAVIFLLHGQVR